MDEKDSEAWVFTVEEVRKRLRLSRGAAYEAIRTGKIPSIRFGRGIRVPASALARLLGESTNNNKDSGSH